MSKTTPVVGVIMGSQSDWQTMRAACEILDALAIPHERRIVSAHRTPRRLFTYASGAKARPSAQAPRASSRDGSETWNTGMSARG